MPKSSIQPRSSEEVAKIMGGFRPYTEDELKRLHEDELQRLQIKDIKFREGKKTEDEIKRALEAGPVDYSTIQGSREGMNDGEEPSPEELLAKLNKAIREGLVK